MPCSYNGAPRLTLTPRLTVAYPRRAPPHSHLQWGSHLTPCLLPNPFQSIPHIAARLLLTPKSGHAASLFKTLSWLLIFLSVKSKATPCLPGPDNLHSPASLLLLFPWLTPLQFPNTFLSQSFHTCYLLCPEYSSPREPSQSIPSLPSGIHWRITLSTRPSTTTSNTHTPLFTPFIPLHFSS